MKLIDKISRSKMLGEQYKKSNELGTRVAELNAFKPKLSQSVKTLEESLQIQETLVEVTDKPYVDVKTIKQSLAIIRRDLSDGKFNVHLSGILLSEADSVKNSMAEAWKKYCSKSLGPAKEIINTIRPLIADDYLYRLMRNAEVRLTGISPGDPQGLDLINQYLDTYHQLMESMELDDRILRILKQLSEKGSIPLDALSAEDLEVFRNLGFTRKLKIMIET